MVGSEETLNSIATVTAAHRSIIQGSSYSQTFNCNSHRAALPYSQRNAVIGSTEDALHDGTKQATPAAARSTTEAPRISNGSWPPPFSTQREISRLNPRLSASPASRPDPTLMPAEDSTFHNTSFFCAPNAMRMPNSFVRCTTE